MSRVLPHDFGQPLPKPSKRIKPNKWRQAPIRQLGKVGKKLKGTREDWFRANADKANWLGMWQCYVCGNWFPKSQLDLDHQLRKGSHPEARFDLDNLKTICRPDHIRKDGGMRVA